MKTFSIKASEYKVWVINIGSVTISTGNTKFKWSIYDWEDSRSEVIRDNPPYIYLLDSGHLLYSTGNSFKIGDKVNLVDNDSQRKLLTSTVKDLSISSPKPLIAMLYKNGYDYRPSKPFQKKPRTRKLRTGWSVKGVIVA